MPLTIHFQGAEPLIVDMEPKELAEAIVHNPGVQQVLEGGSDRWVWFNTAAVAYFREDPPLDPEAFRIEVLG